MARQGRAQRFGRVQTWARGNALGLVAIFIALGGTTYAATKVDSGDIQRNAVKSRHIDNDKLGGEDLGRVISESFAFGTVEPQRCVTEGDEDNSIGLNDLILVGPVAPDDVAITRGGLVITGHVVSFGPNTGYTLTACNVTNAPITIGRQNFKILVIDS